MRLREIRRAAGLTGKQLADSLSWQASKVSKLEHAKQSPSDEDIRAWCRACNAEREAEALIVKLHTLETRHAEWRRLLRSGPASLQEDLRRSEEEVTLFRGFCPVFVPGLVQTPEYARFRFVESAHKFGHRQDVDNAVVARMRRQEKLYQPEKKFHIVITEATLLYALCPPEVMLGQIDRMLAVATLPNVRLGVISFDTFCPVAPKHGFWIEDEDLVSAETFSAELNLAQPQEVEHYSKVFESLALAADYGHKAGAIMTSALERITNRLERQPREESEQS
ncbi:helix-turn-helix transcriptional regulator [Myceligenerans halotolerans]